MTVNNVLFSIAETIPVIGTSIKGALEALYKVLDLIEVRSSHVVRIPNTDGNALHCSISGTIEKVSDRRRCRRAAAEDRVAGSAAEPYPHTIGTPYTDDKVFHGRWVTRLDNYTDYISP
jgi:hypothetical protein